MSARLFKIVSLGVFLTWSTTVGALSCNITTYEDQLERMNNIFLARVESARIFPDIDYAEEKAGRQNYDKRKDRKISIELKIIDVFKGNSIASNYVIRPGWEQTTSPLQVGESYLFSSQGKSLTGDCHMTPPASSSAVTNVLPLLEAYRDKELDSLVNVWRYGDSPGCGMSVDWRNEKKHYREYQSHEDRGAFVVRNYEYESGEVNILDDTYSILIYTSNANDMELQSGDGQRFDIEESEKTQHPMRRWRKVEGMSLADLVKLMRSEETLSIVTTDVGNATIVASVQNRWFEQSYTLFAQCAGIENGEP